MLFFFRGHIAAAVPTGEPVMFSSPSHSVDSYRPSPFHSVYSIFAGRQPHHYPTIPGAADGAIAINTKPKELLDNGEITARIRELETVHRAADRRGEPDKT